MRGIVYIRSGRGLRLKVIDRLGRRKRIPVVSDIPEASCTLWEVLVLAVASEDSWLCEQEKAGKIPCFSLYVSILSISTCATLIELYTLGELCVETISVQLFLENIKLAEIGVIH